jgi:hypothetical protein
MIDITSLETILPFILVVAIVYGSLETANIFRNKAVRTIIAVVMAFFAISNYEIVQLINGLLPYAAILFVVIFIAGYVRKSMSGGDKDNTVVIIIMALALLFIASLAQGASGYSLYQYTEFLWLIGAVVVIAILYGAYKMK